MFNLSFRLFANHWRTQIGGRIMFSRLPSLFYFADYWKLLKWHHLWAHSLLFWAEHFATFSDLQFLYLLYSLVILLLSGWYMMAECKKIFNLFWNRFSTVKLWTQKNSLKSKNDKHRFQKSSFRNRGVRWTWFYAFPAYIGWWMANGWHDWCFKGNDLCIGG